MKNGTVTTARSSFLNEMDGGDKMQNRWGSLFHNNKCLTIKNLAPTDIFVTESATM